MRPPHNWRHPPISILRGARNPHVHSGSSAPRALSWRALFRPLFGPVSGVAKACILKILSVSVENVSLALVGAVVASVNVESISLGGGVSAVVTGFSILLFLFGRDSACFVDVMAMGDWV